MTNVTALPTRITALMAERVGRQQADAATYCAYVTELRQVVGHLPSDDRRQTTVRRAMYQAGVLQGEDRVKARSLCLLLQRLAENNPAILNMPAVEVATAHVARFIEMFNLLNTLAAQRSILGPLDRNDSFIPLAVPGERVLRRVI
jgi:hypothetical protein